MRVLVVRPRAQAEGTARRLALRGHAALLAPILSVDPVPFRLPREKPDALLVTSANAVPAASRHLDRWRELPVFAVGRRTAEALREAGFAEVTAGPGAGADLAKVVAASLPAGRRLLHLAGHDRKAEPSRSLRAAGYGVSVREVYAAVSAAELPGEITEALGAGTLDAALHYSGRSAEILAELAGRAGVAEALGHLAHLCLSADVAHALGDLPAMAPEVAAGPTENAILAALDRVAARVAPSGARAAASPDAIHIPNPARQDVEPPEDNRREMSDPGRSDPLRRTPPTIDIKAKEVGRTDPKPTSAGSLSASSGAVASDEETPSAIEPIAATALGKEPFPKDGRAAPEGKAAPIGSGEPQTDVAGSATPNAPRSSSAMPVTSSPGPKPEPTKPAASPTPMAAAVKPAAGAVPSVAAASSGAAKPAAGKPDPGRPATDVQTSGKPAGDKSAVAAATETHMTPAEPTAQAEPPRRTGMLIAASLVGGIVGAALMAAIGYVWLKPGDLAARMSALETRVASLPAPPANIETRLSALEAGLKQASDTANAAKGAAEGAAKIVQEQGSRPAGAAPDPALRSQVTDLSKRLDELVTGGAAALKELSGKVDGLQGRIQDSLTPSVTALQGSVRTIGETVAALRASAGTQDTRSMDQERRLAAISGDLAKLSPPAFLAALRITVAGRLDDALRAGAPLRPAIAALRKLGTPASSLAPLEPFAEAAPPSAAALAAQFRPLAEQMLAQPETTGQTIGERLRRVAEKVVTVRVVGDGSGQDLPGLVARIQAALGRGDLAAAASDWDRLPDPAKAISSGWAERLKGRVGVDAAARRIAADALGALDTAMP